MKEVDDTTESFVDEASGSRQEKPKKKGGFWRELPIMVAVAIVLAILLRTFVVESFFIPSSSMEKTLHGCPGCTADRVLVNRMVYRFHDPRPGNIVVFSAPDGWDVSGDATAGGGGVTAALDKVSQWLGGGGSSDREKLVKRVIAVGGQSIRCCSADGRVVVDGKPIDEPYVFRDGPDPRRHFRTVHVPQGYLWVMGDHRNVSADSRWHRDAPDGGMVPVKDVVGEPFAIYWPVTRWRFL